MAALLIGGTSHVGKSIVARHLSKRQDWVADSTDLLARHPGRPWTADSKAVPAHVAHHYLELDAQTLMGSVLEHYAKMRPLIAARLVRHVHEHPNGHLALEGSALLPESIVQLRPPSTWAVYLTADDKLIKSRIYDESQYEAANADERHLIDKFLARAIQFNGAMMHDAPRFGLPLIHLTGDVGLEELADQCIRQAACLSS